MNIISSIIYEFSEEDSKAFISFLKSKNRRGDVKNITLFKLLKKGEKKNIDVLLYGKKNKNALHVLSKRLQDSLVDFVAMRSFSKETSEEMEILKLLLSSRIFLEQGNDALGIKLLKKAELKAKEQDLFGVLNEIYHTKIQYAHKLPSQKLSDILTASSKNLQLLQNEQKINAAYATIKYQLKNQEYTSINEIAESVLEEFNLSSENHFTYKTLFQFMKLVSTAANLKRDYYSFSPLLLSIFSFVNEKQVSKEKHLFYHIEILHIMAIHYFRNKDFKTSLDFLYEMEAKCQLQNGKFKSRFKEKVVLLKSLNFQYTGDYEKARQLLTESNIKSPDSLLTLSMFYFQQDQIQKAYSTILKLSHSNIWYEKQMGLLWTLKKNIMEVLLLIELNKLDLVLTYLERFKKNFHKKLHQLKDDRVLPFMNLVADYYKNPKEASSEKFIAKVEKSFIWKEAKAEDIFVMSFYAWLKSKIENKPLYETTLELIKK